MEHPCNRVSCYFSVLHHMYRLSYFSFLFVSRLSAASHTSDDARAETTTRDVSLAACVSLVPSLPVASFFFFDLSYSCEKSCSSSSPHTPPPSSAMYKMQTLTYPRPRRCR
jgi:hypothetical protein